jgi:hypothetical protein
MGKAGGRGKGAEQPGAVLVVTVSVTCLASDPTRPKARRILKWKGS